MGIKGLYKFLRDECPQVFHHNVSLSKFSHSKIAIDTTIYIYKYKTIFGKWWIKSFIMLVFCLRRYNIHCVFVFDGKTIPEKKGEHEKRQKSRQQHKDKISKLKQDLELFKQKNEISKFLQDTHDKYEQDSSVKLRSFLNIQKFNPNIIEEKINKMESQMISILPEDIENTKKVLTNFGVPFYVAPNEAERYAYQLYKSKQVDGVLSDDSDVLAYGTKYFLTSINTNAGTCTFMNSEEIEYYLELDREQFLDFCILCGTDYNSNIPKIGPKTSYKLITTHKNLETLENYKTIPFDYINIRRLFHPSIDNIIVPYCKYIKEINLEKILSLLKDYNFIVDVDYLTKIFSPQKIIRI